MEKCNTCKQEWDGSECWMEDWDEFPLCIDCRAEARAIEADYWYRQYKRERSRDTFDDDGGGYDVDDPKHPDWVDRVMEQAEKFAGAPFPKVVRS